VWSRFSLFITWKYIVLQVYIYGDT